MGIFNKVFFVHFFFGFVKLFQEFIVFFATFFVQKIRIRLKCNRADIFVEFHHFLSPLL